MVTGSEEDRLYWACGQRGLELRKCRSTWVPELLVVTDVNRRHTGNHAFKAYAGVRLEGRYVNGLAHSFGSFSLLLQMTTGR